MATFEAGAIEGTLTLDRRPFLQGMKAAQAQAKAFEDKKYTTKLDADTASISRKLTTIQKKLDAIDGRKASANIDVDTRSASTKLAIIQGAIDDLARRSPTVPVDVDTARAVGHLDTFTQQLAAVDTDRVQPSVDVDLSGVETRLDQLLFQLERLDTDHVQPRIDVDTAAPTAQVEALRAELDRINGMSVSPRIDTAGFTHASLGMQLLVAGAAALAPILVPTLAGGAAAALGLGAALTGAAGGLGVLALGFHGVFGAVKALSTQQTAAVGTTRNLTSSQGQLRSAVRALANARATAADQAISAAERVRNAEQSLRQAETAEEAAVRSLSQARVEARQHLQDLAFATEDADLALRSANLEVKQAKANLDALNKTVGDSTHAQALLTEAQTAYQNLLANPQATRQQREQAAAAIVAAERQVQAAKDGTTATALQRQQARLAYDEAVQRQKEAQVRAQRAAAEQRDAQRKGIAGSDAVVAAEQKIADAQRNVQQAQQSLADAERAQASQRRQSAYAVAQAQQAVADAQRQVAQSSAGAAGGLSQVQKAMDGLSPAGRRFALFLFSLRGYWRDLQATAQSGLLPGVESGIRAMLPLFPRLNRFVAVMAGTFGDLFDEAGHALNAPFWRRFFDFINRTAGPNTVLFASILGNLAEAAAGLIIAFEPFGHELLTWLDAATGRFATWSATLGRSSGFQQFMAFVHANGPLVVDMLIALAKAVLQIGIALAPYAAPILRFLTGLFTAIANTDPATIRHVATAIAGLFLALTGAKAVRALTNLPILGGLLRRVAPAGPWLLLGGAIAALGGYALKSTGHWKDFTDALKKGDIAGALKIGLESMLEMVKNIGPQFVKKLNHALKTTDWHEAGKTFGKALVGALTFTAVTSAQITAAIIQLLSKVDWHQVGAAATGFIGGALEGALEGAFDRYLHALVDNFKESWQRDVVGLAKDVIRGFVVSMDHWWGIFIPGLSLWKWVDLIKKWLGIHSPSTVFYGIGRDVIRGFVNGLESLAGAPPHALSGIINASLGRFAGADRWLYSRGRQIVDGLVDGLNSKRGTANQAVDNLVGGILNRWAGLRDTRSAARYVVNDVMRRLIREFNQVADAFGGKMVDLPKYRHGGPVSHFKNDPGGGGTPSQLAVGGPVRGPGTGTSDSIVAMVSNGEHVWTASEVANAGGHAAVEALRAGARAGHRVPGFAGGGPVTTDPEGSFKADAAQTLKMVSNFTGTAFLRTLQRIPHRVADLAVAHLHKLLASFVGNFTGMEGIPVAAKGAVASIVRKTAAQFGWGTGAEWNALVQIINHESGWRPTAQNPTSTAYGLFQFLNGTWGTVGGHKTSNPALQALYGMRYIGQSYGDPIRAWRFWQGHHWYDQGGWLKPGDVPHNTTGRPEAVLTPDESAALIAVARALASGRMAGDGAMQINVTQNAAPGLSTEQDLERLMRKVETRLRVGRRS